MGISRPFFRVSWEEFDECKMCYAPPKEPCYDLRSRSLSLIELNNPHPGRKKLPK